MNRFSFSLFLPQLCLRWNCTTFGQSLIKSWKEWQQSTFVTMIRLFLINHKMDSWRGSLQQSTFVTMIRLFLINHKMDLWRGSLSSSTQLRIRERRKIAIFASHSNNIYPLYNLLFSPVLYYINLGALALQFISYST